jgi:hypothetical protein
MNMLRRILNSALGDRAQVTLYFARGRLVREDVVITGPPELIDIARRGVGVGRDLYHYEAQP